MEILGSFIIHKIILAIFTDVICDNSGILRIFMELYRFFMLLLSSFMTITSVEAFLWRY